ncbi:MFS transporter [Gryllotalpicola kribbensis]|jgi:MFS family permease|uniref:MFS transporter n=1 Tax=Gryllotalpicola kribbensis TaxID=993084 RepID=A0ABP8AK97_9MICO
MSDVAAATTRTEPLTPVTGRWIALFAAAWLGVWMAQLTPIQLLLPAQIETELRTNYWVDNVLWFGVVSGIAGVCAIIAYPLTGALSDRTTSRFGRRRPWVAGGAALFALALLALGAQTTMAGIAICWALALTGFCVLTAALTAMISDQVPVGQRGYVSGWMSAPQAIGIILGLALVTILGLGTLGGYELAAAALALLVAPFLLVVPDPRHYARGLPPLTPRRIAGELWISPRTHPDFGWTLLSRVLVNLGNAFGTGLLLYFLEFGLGDRNAENDLIPIVFVYMVFVIAASLALGGISDRLQRRKLFVFLASVVQAIAALLLAFLPSLPMTYVGGALLGIGYGCFLAVDQALATQVLPDPETRGKDLGIMNIAWAIPQAFGPLLGGIVVFWLGGFTGLFILAGVAALGGAFAVARVRSVA